MKLTYRIWPSADSLAAAAAELIGETIREAVAARGCCTLAISGGKTPALLFEQLSRPLFHSLPWQSVALFWSDERFVPADHPDSNYRLAREVWLDRMPVKPAAVCPVNTGLPSAAAAAAAYQATLGKTFAAASMRGGWPCFDCILLGVGADGHTASLFPGDSAADNRTDWAAAGRAPDYSQRITLTLPVLNAARKVLFLASGPEKAAIVAAIAAGGVNFPAANVTAETVLWLLDAASGSGLER